MNRNALNDTQFWDEKLNTAYPWYTKPCLDFLETLDLKDKNVLEFGAGFSTIWWAKKANSVFSIEANKEWLQKISPEIAENKNTIAVLREVNEGDQSKIDFYTDVSEIQADFQIVIVDGILRNECLQKGIELLSVNGGLLIADNWQQDFVWMSPAAEKIMEPYERKIFIEPTHKNHEGNPWKTAVFTIPKL